MFIGHCSLFDFHFQEPVIGGQGEGAIGRLSLFIGQLHFDRSNDR